MSKTTGSSKPAEAGRGATASQNHQTTAKPPGNKDRVVSIGGQVARSPPTTGLSRVDREVGRLTCPRARLHGAVKRSYRFTKRRAYDTAHKAPTRAGQHSRQVRAHAGRGPLRASHGTCPIGHAFSAPASRAASAVLSACPAPYASARPGPSWFTSPAQEQVPPCCLLYPPGPQSSVPGWVPLRIGKEFILHPRVRHEVGVCPFFLPLAVLPRSLEPGRGRGFVWSGD